MNGAQLARARIAAQLSQAELAEEAGQHQPWVSRLERRVDVHPSVADVYLGAIEACLQRREGTRRRVGSKAREVASL